MPMRFVNLVESGSTWETNTIGAVDTLAKSAVILDWPTRQSGLEPVGFTEPKECTTCPDLRHSSWRGSCTPREILSGS